jgi:hypothetical protein
VSDFEDRYRKWHTYMSYAKSAVRIVGCFLAVQSIISLEWFAFFIGVAEIVGILEEWV